jgi:hypothetical protein
LGISTNYKLLTVKLPPIYRLTENNIHTVSPKIDFLLDKKKYPTFLYSIYPASTLLIGDAHIPASNLLCLLCCLLKLTEMQAEVRILQKVVASSSLRSLKG